MEGLRGLLECFLGCDVLCRKVNLQVITENKDELMSTDRIPENLAKLTSASSQ